MKSKPSKHPHIQVRGHFLEADNKNDVAHRSYQYHVHIEDEDSHNSQDYERVLNIKSLPPQEHIAIQDEAPSTNDDVIDEVLPVSLQNEIEHEAHTPVVPEENIAEDLNEELPEPVSITSDVVTNDEVETDEAAEPIEDEPHIPLVLDENAAEDLDEELPEAVSITSDAPADDEIVEHEVAEQLDDELPYETELEAVTEEPPSPILATSQAPGKHRFKLKQGPKQWLSAKPIATLLGVLLIGYLLYIFYKAGVSVSQRLPGITSSPSNNAASGKQQTIAIPLHPARQGLPAQPPIDEPGEPYTVIQQHEVIHTVVWGDTLWFIAKRYVNNPLRYPELARLSNIEDPDLIYPGDRVRIFVEK